MTYKGLPRQAGPSAMKKRRKIPPVYTSNLRPDNNATFSDDRKLSRLGMTEVTFLTVATLRCTTIAPSGTYRK